MFRKTPLHTVTDAVTHFFPQVNKPIVKVSLQEFVSNLTKAAKAMETVSQVKSTCVQ